MDMNEFAMDLSGHVPPSQSPTLQQQSPSAPYYSFQHPSNYYLAGTPGYGAVSYATSSWPATPSLPLSSYSSLNGATTTSSQSPPSQQPSAQSPPHHPPPPPPVMINPSMTLNMNGSSSSPPPQYQTTYLSHTSHAQQRSPYTTYQHSPPPSTMSINPSFVHTTPSHFQQIHRQSSLQQTQPSPQATLSPYHLHSPPIPTASSPPISTSSFYAQPQLVQPAPPPPPQPSGPTPEQLRERFLAGLKPLLQPNYFSGGGAVQKLTGHIDDYGILKVDVPTRLDILVKIRDNAPNHYFRAWAENNLAMLITKRWLTDSVAEGKTESAKTTMPLLHILDRLPMSIECLKDSGIGKEVKRVSKSSSNSAIRDMASNIASKWRALLPPGPLQTPASTKASEDAELKSKKRKAEELPAAAKGQPAAKRGTVTTVASTSKTTTAATAAKKPSAKGTAVKDAKTDTSFFSAAKPKPKLPDFKKAAVTVKKEQLDPTVAPPSSYNHFEDLIKSIKPRKESPAVATPPPPATVSGPAVPADPKSLSKKKSVTWAPDGQLELVKIIERAVYDDDAADGMHGAHSVRELERGEGAALIAHLFEEQVDWSEPLIIEIPPEIEISERGKDSIEKIVQDEREQNALGALYMADNQIPESAGEPAFLLPDDQVDIQAKPMLVGEDVEALFWSGAPAPAAMASSVAELVGQLTAGSVPDVVMADAAAPPAFDPNVLANIRPEQLQQLVQQAQALQGVAPPYPPGPPGPPPPTGPRMNGEQEWNAPPFQDYDRAYEDKDRPWGREDGWADHGARGRGRGKGRGEGFGRGGGGGGGFRGRKRPCTFFQQGRQVALLPCIEYLD
ncbi:hypothetical protein PsYK624_008940 [Phanerochaete sordida]|uniref:TFIIS N-terminal domain-containing protein n=1 Tax=Phanerochaete sordida TaxID=48140 RepID=A0A9P3FYB2_9APHY|nr:hypothetical protein PsYK624_008940 [Phanerochaete sordida]